MTGAEGAVGAPPPLARKTSLLPLATVTLLVGVAAGLAGTALALLLHLIQHLAYRYNLDALVGPESFLQGVSATSAARRVAVMTLCGGVAGVGWWAVYRIGRPLVSVSAAIKADDHRMPAAETTAHVLLQIVTVALGSPLGREVAPRELGAMVADRLSRLAGLSADESRIMVACGAGAGLAAVYDVPLGGAVFVLEVLLGTFSPAAIVPALATCVIAATLSWLGLGKQTQYTIDSIPISASLIAWSIVAGPVFGFAADGFTWLAKAARSRAPRTWPLLLWAPLTFLGIGLLAVGYPELLGNGKGPTQMGFDNHVGGGLAATLLALKVLVTAGALRAGAEGGLLTPGLTIGALLAIVLGGAWNLLWPAVPAGAFAIVGAAAFLASSMTMPITAIVLVFEFTRVDQDFLTPILCAVAGSVAASRAGWPFRTMWAPVGGRDAT